MTRVYLSTALLGLAWFVIVNATAALAALALARAVADCPAVDTGRARRLLMLRFLPFGAAAVVTLAMFAPAHLWWEPAVADERFGVTLTALAAIGVLLAARSVWRMGVLAVAAARLAALTRTPTGDAASPQIVEVPLLGGIALVGVLRPRVLVGSSARAALTPAELAVAIAHERAHQQSRDNLTRVLMRITPDLFALTPTARRIERLWEAEAECLADARAVGGDPARARRLASALVKVARLRGHGAADAQLGWSMFHQPALLAARVRLLVECADCEAGDSDRQHRAAVPGRLAPFVAVPLAAVAVAWFAGVPRALHQLTEALIARLP